MDGEQYTRLTRRIHFLQEKRDGLRDKLSAKESFHAAAWAEYGSELCAGGMVREERAIEQEIRAVEGDIELLRQVRDGAVPLEADPEAVGRLEEIQIQLGRLQDEKRDIEAFLARIERARSLLG
ncbi:hypothetical protein AMJ57_01850 [Parcubacteria bacterium SG8_24]|nr:MAG: hypothetical protein AMJ57_01850 [Parcubacteria bacterium SG8_24]